MIDNGTDPQSREAETNISPVPRVTIQAFCERQNTASAISSAASDRRMMKAHIKVHMGGAPAAVEAFREAPTPNVIFVEASGGREVLIEQLDALAETCDPGTKVVVVGSDNDIVLYRELISRGVSDYIVAPIKPLTVVRTVSSLYASGTSKAIGRVIAVTGVKGGVGASTIAHNVAFLISNNYEVPTVLVDLDLAFGTAALNFNQDPTSGMAEVLAASSIDGSFVDRLLSRCTERLSLLAAPATLEKAFDPPEERLDGLVDVLRTTTPMTVLDVPSTWTSWSRRMLVTADEIVLVAVPDLACLRNAKTMYDVLCAARPNDTPPRVVLNTMGVPKRGEIALADFTRAIEADPLCAIPFDPKIFGTAANNGQMLAELGEASKINELFCEITRTLVGRTETRPQKKASLLSPLTALLNRAMAS